MLHSFRAPVLKAYSNAHLSGRLCQPLAGRSGAGDRRDALDRWFWLAASLLLPPMPAWPAAPKARLPDFNQSWLSSRTERN
jgi:hypothetical protein